MRMSEQALLCLRQLAAEGRLSPNVVVEEAASEDSPLHGYFEWDEQTAAHKYRITQARDLIRSVKVEVVVRERTVVAPRYVHDPKAKNNQGYVDVESARDDKDAAREIVMAEVARAVTAMERANRVAAAVGLESEVTSMIENLSELYEALAQPGAIQ